MTLPPLRGQPVAEAFGAVGVGGRQRLTRRRQELGRRAQAGPDAGQYVTPFACNIRYRIRMNLREAMHLIELRTQPAGHPSYRDVCQQMHRLIERAHPLLGRMLSFTDHSEALLAREQQEARKGDGRDP